MNAAGVEQRARQVELMNASCKQVLIRLLAEKIVNDCLAERAILATPLEQIQESKR